MQGDRGLLAMMRMNQQRESLQHELAEVTTEREYWEHRTRMLRPESIDPDMLNEVVRRTLGYVDQDDVVLPRPLMISDRPLLQHSGSQDLGSQDRGVQQRPEKATSTATNR